jgi:hypothetical protein
VCLGFDSMTFGTEDTPGGRSRRPVRGVAWQERRDACRNEISWSARPF